jgi:DNA-binding SARP family transcriptional activator/predicted negative regulator of RcsB-dependent stress response
MDDAADINAGLDRSEIRGLTIQGANRELKQARLAGDPAYVFTAVIRLAQLHFRQGRYNRTQALLAEVLQDAPPDSVARCDALRVQGNCAAELGEPERAETYYYQAIDLARELDDRFTLYKCLHSLATNIYWQHGQFDLMLAAGQEALSQAQALGLKEDLWFPLSDIAWGYWVTGQIELANRVADQMEQCVIPGSLGYGFYCCLRAGLVQHGSDFLDTVLPLYQVARSIAESTGDPGLNAEVRLGLCHSYRLAGNLPAAASWADDAVATTERMNYRQFMATANIERARTAMDAGDLDQALADLHTSIELSTQLQANFDLARSNLYLAAVFFTRNDSEAASAWAQATRLIQNHGYGFLLQQERTLVLPLIAANLDSSDSDLAQASKELYSQFLRTTPAPIQVKMLGQFSVWVGPNSVSKDTLRKRRAGELLALLLISPNYYLTFQQVAEAMCPEKDPEAALDFYHHAISALRRLLEPELPDRRFICRYLDVDDEQIKLNLPPGSKVDYQEFEAYCQEQAWERAVEAYTGEFLPALRYAEWAIPLRQHLADRHEQALMVLVEKRLKAGAAADCLALVRQVLLHNPWHEQAVGLGMRAALELGNRTTALRLYLRLEKVLHKELGISPHKELLELYAQAQRRIPKK